MNKIENLIFTVGHSNHAMGDFVALLQQHHVTSLVDVRSVPYSGFNPHFNRDSLVNALKASEIEYVYMGRELGGRSEDPACYEGGRVRYDRVAATELFRCGLDHIISKSERYRIALMCMEKEPLECHRTLLVSKVLDEHGIEVAHIHADGALETHGDAMDRLLSRFALRPEGELFLTREELINEAVDRQAKRFAFVDKNQANPSTGAIQ